MPTAHVNGVDLYYEDTGAGFPVVFCHEFGGDYRAWDPQVRAFSRLYRCVTYSQRARRGCSGRRPRPWTT